ncbi:pilus assembly PilX family protein [Lysobacter terrae]
MIAHRNHFPAGLAARRRQSGVTTLAISLILLVIISLMVVFSSNVGFFEQRTTTNENRARMAQSASEYALNLAGEYLKANRNLLISNTGTGWLATGANRRWVKCSDVGTADADFPTGHPCLSERFPARRAKLYFWTDTGAVDGNQALPYRSIIPDVAEAEAGMGGTAAFATTTNVRALLCRLDTSDPSNVQCALEPTSGNRVALYLISDAQLTNESGQAEAKEAWATYSSFVPTAAVPLIASGYVQGLGNGQIVAAPNAGGYGLPGSIWSPHDVDIEATSGGGVGSVSTCYVGDYLKSTPEADLKTTCATSNNACGCDASSDTATTYLSGHAGSVKREREDILDVDSNLGTLPDITFFPGAGLDKVGDNTDDSLFEYTFNPVTNVVADHDATGTTLVNCGDTGTQNCFDYVMREEFDPEIMADCSGLSSSSSGIIYVTGACTSLPTQVGTPESPAIVVINQGSTELHIGSQLLFYGMLFLHSDDQSASMRGNGNAKVFGAVVVEGSVDFNGSLTVIYDDSSVSSDTHKLPKSAKFGRVPGSWLDAKTAF